MYSQQRRRRGNNERAGNRVYTRSTTGEEGTGKRPAALPQLAQAEEDKEDEEEGESEEEPDEDEHIAVERVGLETKERVHDDLCADGYARTGERVLDHEPRVDLVDRQRLERVLERREPLEPLQDGRDRREVDEEACEGHLEEDDDGRDEDGGPGVVDDGREEEVPHGRHEGEEDEDEEELEEAGGRGGEAHHPAARGPA